MLIAILLLGVVAVSHADATAAVFAAAGSQGDVKLVTGGLMAVVTKRHQDDARLASESIVVTPDVSPRVKLLDYSDLVLDVALTGSMSNWKEIVFQNSAKPGWELRFNENDLAKQRARDPGDWFRVPLFWNDLEDGVANCISVRLIDKGSHKNGPLGIGKKGIANPNLLTFTIDVIDRKVYPYERGDGKIQADPKWGVSPETSHLLLSEEGPWNTALPDWYDEEVRSSIRVRPPVERSVSRQQPDPPRYPDPPARSDPPPAKPAHPVVSSDRLTIEILQADSGVEFTVTGDVVNISRPIATATRWSYGRRESRTVTSPTAGLRVPWRPGVSSDITVDIRKPDGRWQQNVGTIRVTVKGGAR
jgi:hypothetical protein